VQVSYLDILSYYCWFEFLCSPTSTKIFCSSN